MPTGRSTSDAMAGFEGRTASEVEVTAPVAFLTRDGEIMIAVDGKQVPVFTGFLRQPVSPGEIITVEGWQEPDGRRRILASSILTSDGRQVFP